MGWPFELLYILRVPMSFAYKLILLHDKDTVVIAVIT